MEYYSAMKKSKTRPFAATWLDLEIIIPTELRQTKTKTIWCPLHIESKKGYKQTFLQNVSRLTDGENKPMVTEGESGEGAGID